MKHAPEIIKGIVCTVVVLATMLLFWKYARTDLLDCFTLLLIGGLYCERLLK